ncbi:hypothetical protein [Bacillus cereus group sp. BfR-BA-01380]|uniref:hypothetical protein n=1 Tax=Bacillus cereus group sp. BfR-BA-01380 TaxID=2920324 RepID=UPI001F59AA33|nr:hypothetical protein [Bacillus cereus group sp. BfR-BA-01380]
MSNIVARPLSRYSWAIKAGEKQGRKLPVKARLSGLSISEKNIPDGSFTLYRVEAPLFQK